MADLAGDAAGAAMERARESALALLEAIRLGKWRELADAADAAYLRVGRLAVLARAKTLHTPE